MKGIDPVVVVPIHTTRILPDESRSLRRMFKVLSKHRIVLAMPTRLRDEGIRSFVAAHGGSGSEVDVAWFADHWFESVRSYNRMLIRDDFYAMFEPHSHLLIYQLDAWVFEDRLEEFCEMEFDFLGAPWFEGLRWALPGQGFLRRVGNGGFSLRSLPAFRSTLAGGLPHVKIESFREMLFRLQQQHRGSKRLASMAMAPFALLFRNTLATTGFPAQLQEDMFWAFYADRLNPGFRNAPSTIGIEFSWECNPRCLYERTGGRLPFGCHAWNRYDPGFWSSWIKD